MSEFEDKIFQASLEDKLGDSKTEEKKSLLIGEPIPWSDIKEEDHQREWLWENYIAKGSITLLSALWKAGKSTLLRCLFVAMENEEEFAGQPTKKCKVLVVSEEDSGDWVDKREDIEEDLGNILVWARPIRVKPTLRQWIDMIQELSKICLEKGVDLVVIDTLSTFWPIDNENDSAQVMKALVPLYNFTENNIGVLLVHHFRKGGGDQAQASRGSGALPGFVSNIVEFTRSEDGYYNQRILKTYGRFDNVIPKVVIELMPNGKYKTLGEPWEVSKSARMDKIIDIFEQNPNKALSAKEVFNTWSAVSPGISERSVRRYVKELHDKNILSAVDSRLIGKRLTPFYALKGNYAEQRTIAFPPTLIPGQTSVNSGQESNELSVVDGNRAPAPVRTGTSVGMSTMKKPDPRW